MRLPQEIYDLIIDHLHNDKLSLRSCALVSRGWAYRSQVHIFYFLILRDERLRCWLDTFSPSDQRIHSLTKCLMLTLPANSSPGEFTRFPAYASAFKNLRHLLINGRNSLHVSQQFPCIRWFGHLRNTLKSLELNSVAVNPCIIAAFPRLEFLSARCSRLPSAPDPDEGGAIHESDLHDAFKGTLEFDIYSWNSGAGLLAAFAACPLGYDTIRIDARAADGTASPLEAINGLTSRCSDTLEVLDIKLRFEQLCKSGPAQPRPHLPHTLPMSDVGLDLSPFRCLREISLALVIGHGLGTHLPRFSTITSGTVSKITFTAKLGSRAKELYSLFGAGCEWTGADEDLLRLAEFQGGNNGRRVELVIDLRKVGLGQSHLSGRERKSLERNWWIQSASKHVFPKFSQAGTIDFVLPPPVSGSVPYFPTGGVFTFV